MNTHQTQGKAGGPFVGAYILATGAVSAMLVACGGGGGSEAPTPVAPTPPAAVVTTAPLAFIACPQFRDVRTTTVINNACWVAEYNGKMYSLRGASGSVIELKHKLLVEAVEDSASTETFCNGKTLTSLRVSRLPEVDMSCDTIRQAEGVVFDPPAAGGGGGPPPTPAPPIVVAAPYASKSYTVTFYHQSEFLNGAAQVQVETAASLAKLGAAKKIVVKGFASNTQLSNGTVSPETAALAKLRAERVVYSLKKLKVPDSIITTEWDTNVATGDATKAYQGRTVTIDVTL